MTVEIRMYVISTLRPDAVEVMRPWTEGAATWIVTPGEAPAYEQAGARRVVECEGLSRARNVAIEDAGDAWCLQLSDDLVDLKTTTGKKAADASPTMVNEVADVLAAAMLERNVYLGGVAPTANPFYSAQRVNERGFVVGDLIVIRPGAEPRFDEELSLKEDYDYTLQHLERYGAVARLDWILATFKHRTNPGGACARRTDDLEQETIGRLLGKWPARLRPNPRRANELLLRWPR